ncbi:uncharacterized protein [Phaenicophaeus curvirostris]|uniref:uncharacterized protein n=1 Tax=Phaenicophaeus curvirostris TaxID=33595 RepID=UPI0037F0E6BF
MCTRAPVTEMAFDTANPYGNCSGSAEDYKDARTLLRKSMDELDSPEYMPNGLDPSIWERFCLARRNKMETEELALQDELKKLKASIQETEPGRHASGGNAPRRRGWCRNPGAGKELRESGSRLESGERRPVRLDQPGGEDAPGPARKMEALVKAQAQGLRAHEVMATTRAAREAIRTASRVIAKPSSWSTIKQSESESFTQFVDRLQAAVDSSSLPAEAKGPVVAECLRQQCNSATKEILRSLPVGSSIADMIKHVAKEERLAPIQMAVSTAIANVMACSKCGQVGHVVTNCPRFHDLPTAFPLRQNRPRGPCWVCGKQGHFAKECSSKTQGNGRGRGHLGRARLSPTWDTRRPNYANPEWGEAPLNLQPPRQATNFMAQPAVQSNLPISQGQQGPPSGGETPGWPWQ